MPNPPKCPIRAVASPMYVLSTRWGRLPRSQNGAESSEIYLAPDMFVARGLRFVRMKKRHRAQIGEDSPKAALCLEVRKFSVWVCQGDSAVFPTWFAVIVLFQRSTGRLRLGEIRADSAESRNVAQLFGRLGSPFFPSRKIPPRTIRGHSPKVALRPEVSR